MTYRGTIHRGVVVLDGSPRLEDGTRVEVLVHAQAATSGFRPVGSWDGPPGELDRLLAEVQALRDADVSLERDRGDDGSLSP